MIFITGTQQDYIERVADLHDGRITVLGQYTHSKVKLDHACNVCNHTWSAKPNNILNGNGCSRCNKPKKSVDRYKQQLLETHKGVISLCDAYAGSNIKALHQCNGCKHMWNTRPDNILRGRGCPRCKTHTSKLDVVYLWKVTELAGVYKVGVTSSHLGHKRIREVEGRSGLRATNIITKHVDQGDALLIEDALLKLGTPVSFDEPFNGYTEFRSYTDSQLTKAHSLLMS